MQSLRTKEEKLSFKNRLKQFCQQTIEQRIIFARNIMDNAQTAANSEEKSSAGDKYETSRAMNHLEKDMHARQLAAHMKELSDFSTIKTDIIYQAAAAGAFIVCQNASFFLAAGLGKQSVNGMTILFLSPNAPLAEVLINKKPGDRFIFNGNEMIMTDVY